MADPYREPSATARIQTLLEENWELQRRIRELEQRVRELETDNDLNDGDADDDPRGPEEECPRCGVASWCGSMWHAHCVTEPKWDGELLHQRCRHCGAKWSRLPLKDE